MSNTVATPPLTVVAVPPIRLTRQQLLEYQRSVMKLKELKVRIIDDGGLRYHGQYWRSRFNGYSTEQSEAGLYDASEALDGTGGVEHLLFELVDVPESKEVPPEPPPVRLTIRQCEQNRSEVGNKMCRWVSTLGHQSGMYARKPLGTGCTHDLEEAQVFQVSTILDEWKAQNLLLELLDQETARRIMALPVRLCMIEEALDWTMIEGLKLQPTNPVYRATVLARLGKMPPAELSTWEQVKDWIEFNCEPKVKVENHTPPPAPPPTPPPQPVLHINLHFTDTEVGRCRYRVDRSGGGVFEVDRNAIVALIEEHDPSTVDELISHIDDLVSEDPHSVDPDMETVEDGASYDNHEIEETMNSDWEYDDSPVRRRQNLITFLLQNISREQLEQLGIAP